MAAARSRNVVAADRAPIDHGGQLPESLPYSIVLRAADEPDNPIVQTLVGYLPRAHRQAVSSPAARPAARSRRGAAA